MPSSKWSSQEAKNRFGALIGAALAGVPQRVTRRGQPAVVVLSVEEYERLHRPVFLMNVSSTADAGMSTPWSP